MEQNSQKVQLLMKRPPSPGGVAAVVSSEYTTADRLTAWKARWGIDRMGHTIIPGLYALGKPDSNSPVFATANYRLSFDALRTNLKGIDAWLLVLDTKGINVWCAAGKGTFGTLELTRSIQETGLENVVSHRRITLPQLGAPGVCAQRVQAYTGFAVAYGPVRAEDLPEYLRLGGKATPEMRRVRFTFSDRMVLAPMQLVQYGKYLLPAAILMYMLGFRTDAAFTAATLIAGTVLVPALLPWLPGRSFAIKSAEAGLLVMAALYPVMDLGHYELLGRALIYASAASFIGLDFTGASTYTSLSGVKKEMRASMPVQALGVLAGLAILGIRRFL